MWNAPGRRRAQVSQEAGNRSQKWAAGTSLIPSKVPGSNLGTTGTWGSHLQSQPPATETLSALIPDPFFTSRTPPTLPILRGSRGGSSPFSKKGKGVQSCLPVKPVPETWGSPLLFRSSFLPKASPCQSIKNPGAQVPAGTAPCCPSGSRSGWAGRWRIEVWWPPRATGLLLPLCHRSCTAQLCSRTASAASSALSLTLSTNTQS